ncbi:DUF2280 domain-containing protein [uncultured Ferrovibrio sp.]|uniref:DUF2280 domain-containing protein n=1 Tax=uncultured Ferrovibrio sp. TaxID=1576913 RepID=UPI00261FF253|nr:DUF2280 domain-containing protein [uncultured Ferrovibrio sp.]
MEGAEPAARGRQVKTDTNPTELRVMAKLDEATKRLIVMELACYRTPSEVVEIVGEKLGIKLDRRQVFDYAPYGSHGDRVPQKWRDLFDATRKQFLKDTAEIPIAQRIFRLRELNDMEQRAKARGNYALAAQLLEQAAKECGDVYTNQQRVKHSGAVATYEATPEQIDAELRELLGVTDAPEGH